MLRVKFVKTATRRAPKREKFCSLSSHPDSLTVDFHCQMLILKSVTQPIVAQYPVDENGIEIRPGYRLPFQKGDDPRRFKGPYRSYKGMSVADASRVIAKLESLVDELRRKKTSKSSRANSTKNHGLQLSDTVAKVAPISTVKPMANPAPIPPVTEVQKPANTPEIDDCPF